MTPWLSEHLTDLALVFGLLLPTLFFFYRRGLFRNATFATSPSREGNWQASDFGIGLILYIAGPLVLKVLFALLQIKAAFSLNLILIDQLANLPLILFILYRAHVIYRGRSASFGLGLTGTAFLKDVLWTFKFALILPPLIFGIAGLIQLLPYPAPPETSHQLLNYINQNPTPIIIAKAFLIAIILAPLTEEILYRGLMQTLLIQKTFFGRRWLSIIVTSLFFTLVHIPVLQVTDPATPNQTIFAWQALFVLITLSLVLGYAYERTGRLWVPIFIHALFNAVQLTISLLLFSPLGKDITS